MNNKKGISAIVATVLIILITVAAVTIIWAAIIPMIQDQIGGSTECFDASAALSVVTDYSCYNAATDTAEIQVHRSTGNFELTGMDVIISSEGTTTTVRNTSTIDENGDKVLMVDYSSAGFANDPDEVAVAAVVKAGNTEKVCDKSGMVTLRACATS